MKAVWDDRLPHPPLRAKPTGVEVSPCPLCERR